VFLQAEHSQVVAFRALFGPQEFVQVEEHAHVSGFCVSFDAQVVEHSQTQVSGFGLFPTGQIFKQAEQRQEFAFISLLGPQFKFGQHISGRSSDPSAQSLSPSHLNDNGIQEI
jgi:hypothetical protein